jgi:hypothetical protein
MRQPSDRALRQAAGLVLLAAIDLAVSLPIMGATYRPFNWMSIAPADATTLYPVIRSISTGTGRVTLEVGVPWRGGLAGDEGDGSLCILQSSSDLSDPTAWRNVCSGPVRGPVVLMDDTNLTSGMIFYRVLQIPGRSR